MAKTANRKLTIAELQLGMRVKLPLSWTNHPFLFNRIDITTPAHIEMIRGLGVPYVYLISGDFPEAAESDAVVQTATDEIPALVPERDIKAETRKAIRLSQQQFIQGVNNNRGIFGKVVSDPEGAYRLSATLVEDMLAHLQTVENPYLTLVGSSDKEVSITQHCVSVAVLALMIAKALDLSMREMRDIALGSLLHDIGKLKVPDAIRRKRTGLTTHESNYLLMHPNFGHEMLNRSGLFPKEVLHIVRHHHELIDGSGYPDNLAAEQLPLTTQIVSLANDYQQQLSDQHMSSPQVALGYLFKNRATKHADNLISVLVKVLGIYPPGTLVHLSDGSVAKVMMTTQDVSQPHVWACTLEGEAGALRFLVDEGVTVDRALKVEELTEGAIRTLQVDNSISFYFSGI